MGIIILHSPLDGASREFIATLGVTPPEGDDVMVSVGGVGVRIVSDHAKCVGIQPAFRAYPTLVFIQGGETYTLDSPANWQQCLAFMEDPVGRDAPKRVLTQFEFANLFTPTERKRIRAASKTDEDVEDLLDVRNSAQMVDLDLPMTAQALGAMAAMGLLTPERVAAILAGEAPA